MRSKLSIAFSLVIVTTLLSMMMATAVFLSNAPAAHAASASQANTVAGTSSTSVTPHQIPIRLPHQKGKTSVVPSASPGTSVTPNAVLHNFNGVSSVDSAKVNAGTDVEPPDQGLCVGNGYVMEPVNLALTIYTMNGTVVKGPVSLPSFFGEPPAFNSAYGTDVQGDVRCYYDASTNTWFATQLFLTTTLTNNVSHFDVAVNPSGNPTTPWKVYRFDTTDLNVAGCPCFGDQPLFGIDQYNIYISTNEFSITGSAFNGSQIYAISKSQLISEASKVNFVHFRNLNIYGNVAFSIEPAISDDANVPAEYFLDSLDFFGTFADHIGVWAMTNRQCVTSGGCKPTLSSTVISSETYGYPPSAQTPVGFNQSDQENTSGLIQNDDDRMLQVQEINGKLWSTLDTAANIPGQDTVLSGAAWFEVTPSLNGDMIGKSTMAKQGYVVAKGSFLMYPAVAATSNGSAAMVMTITNSTTYPSAVYTTLVSGNKSFGAIQVGAFGAQADIGFTAVGGPGRWGDYSAAVMNPSGGGIWMATEYIPGPGDGVANWGTRVLEVSA
jgi:hypothetical protein